MKVTRLGRSRPLMSITTIGTDTGSSGSVLTSMGSNGSTYWGPNVATITSNGSNLLTGPFVNFASGSNTFFAAASNTLTITSSGGAASTIVTSSGSNATTEGFITWDALEKRLKLYDGQRDRSMSAVGWVNVAHPTNYNQGAGLASSSSIASGISLALPMRVDAHMLLDNVQIINRDTTLARTWGWDLYVQRMNNGNASESTLDRVAQSNGNETFTAAAVSTRTLDAASKPVYLGPGIYWLVIQNRHASNGLTMAIGSPGNNWTTTGQSKGTSIPNGATLDFVAASWTKTANYYGVAMIGRVFGETTGWQ